MGKINDSTKPRGAVYCFLHRFPPEITGAGLQMKRIAERLAKDGLAVEFLTPGENDEETRTETGLCIRRFRWQRAGSRLEELKLAARMLRFLRKRREEMQALQICGLSRVNYLLLAWAQWAGVPVVYRAAMLGGDDPQALEHERLGDWKVKHLGGASAMVTTTPKLEASFRNSYPGKRVWLIPNGVDCTEFRPAANAEEKRSLRESLGLPGEARILASTGVACPRKRTDFLLRAVARLQEEDSDLVYVHLGAWTEEFAELDLDYTEQLQRAAADFPPGTLRIEGQSERVPEFLRASDVFLFASRKEGCPNAVLEAMASGLPVVMTRLEAVEDFLVREGEEGAVVEDNEDMEAFVARVRGLLLDERERQRLGENGRRRVERYFGIDRAAARYQELYRWLGAHH